MDPIHDCGVLLGRRGRFDMRDEIGSLLITGFRQMDFIPLPEQIPLGAVPCIRVVR